MEEQRRLDEPAANGWKTGGPYLSERQWGTVREDYSPGGTAWDSLSHDAARSRAYRWGEDGIFGISDARQILCFSTALWNGRDPILKERLFGLTNSEGNHGEDVKECYNQRFSVDYQPGESTSGLFGGNSNALCLRGGIPPALFVQDRSGASTLLLVTGPAGEPLTAQVVKVAGEAIELTGTITRVGGWLIVRTDPTTWHTVPN
jgi:hypothetical protein